MSDSISVVGPHEGSLLVSCDIADFSTKYVLDCGTRISRFIPSDVDPRRVLAGSNLLANGDLASDPVEWQVTRRHDGVDVGRNVSPAWTVLGGNTGYLVCETDIPSATVRYIDPVLGPDIPVLPGEDYVAIGHFAAHRCRGQLKVVVRNDHGSVVAEKSAAISNNFSGGTDLNGYQQLGLQLRMPETAATARYEIELVGHSQEAETDLDAYIFFTRCGLVQASPGTLTWAPRSDKAAALLELSQNVRKGTLYEAAVDTESILNTRELVVRPLERDVSEPTASYALLDTSGITVTIGTLAGNAVDVAVSGYDDAVKIYVDNQLLRVVPRSRESGLDRRATILVDDVFFDGADHLLEARDSSGFRILARIVDFFPSVLTPWASLQQFAGHPLPAQLAPAAAHRYRNFVREAERFDGSDEESRRRMATLARLHRVLEGGFETLEDFPPLEFPAVDQPVVSVVVPVHNKFNVTYFCLCALLFAANETTFEVILVDDGSDDQTLEIDEIVSNITVVRSESAQGFVRACNVGAERARGRYIALLNNDTEPTLGWLDELVAAFDTFDDVGLVGSKLLYPDGRLQEAGGIVWRSGNPWNYGRGQNPHDPRYSYSRQVDYLSGAALMLSRDVWAEVGGLSDEYAPAYFEDTDLGFKVRAAGYTTWFVPSSVVYHFEGLSNGTDVKDASSLKRYQEINRPKFKRNWAAAVRNNGEEGVAPDLAKDREILGRVLFIDYQVPRPDHDAGSYAVLQEIKLVQSLGYKVSFVATNMAYMGHYTEAMNRMGVETIHAPFYFSIDDFLRQRGPEYDAVYIIRYGVAQSSVPSVRAHAPQAKILFNNCDLHFLREMRVALRAATPEAWGQAVAVREDELAVMRDVDVVLSYNEVEHAIILSHNLAQTQVATCPWVVEVSEESTAIGFTEREGVAFLGNYLHPPNVEAVHFFVDEVMPLLKQRLPDLVLNLYGAAMPESIKDLASPSVNPVGHVASVQEMYDANRVFVAPLLTGAGLKGKVLGAMAHGIPTVVSPVAAEGTGLRDGYDCRIASDPSEWVEAVAALYEKDEIWESVRMQGIDLVRRNYSFEGGRVLMRQAFEAVGIFNTKP